MDLQHVTDELSRRGFDAELWNTGGGTMCAAAVLERDTEGMAVRYLLVTAEDSWLVGFYDEGIQDGDEGVVAWTGIDPEKDGSVGELGEWVVGLFARLNLRMRASEDPATVA